MTFRINRFRDLLFIFFGLQTGLFARFEFTVSTDKETYSYGEPIEITCTVTNAADTTVTLLATHYDSYQAEFFFNEFSSLYWSIGLPLSQELIFPPKSEKHYSWIIDPAIYGLPDKEGTQTIAAYYFYDELKDTVFIQAPRYLGGQLNVGFDPTNDTLLTSLKDSLNISVLSSYIPLETICETWQITGFYLDSLYEVFNNDSRFEWVEYNRQIQYDSITMTSVETPTSLASEFYLSNAFPNPFNPTTTVYLETPKTERGTVVLYDGSGKRISTIFNDVFIEHTRYQFEVDGSCLPSGIYLLVAKTSNFHETKKLILLK